MKLTPEEKQLLEQMLTDRLGAIITTREDIINVPDEIGGRRLHLLAQNDADFAVVSELLRKVAGE
jgi:hypothetical protein